MISNTELPTKHNINNFGLWPLYHARKGLLRLGSQKYQLLIHQGFSFWNQKGLGFKRSNPIAAKKEEGNIK